MREGPLALERGDAGRLGRGSLGSKVVLGGVGLKVFEMQFHLIEQAAGAFGAGAVLLPLQLGDLQLEVGDDRLGGALAGLGIGEPGLGIIRPPGCCRQQRLERCDIVRKRREGGFHTPE